MSIKGLAGRELPTTPGALAYCGLRASDLAYMNCHQPVCSIVCTRVNLSLLRLPWIWTSPGQLTRFCSPLGLLSESPAAPWQKAYHLVPTAYLCQPSACNAGKSLWTSLDSPIIYLRFCSHLVIYLCYMSLYLLCDV